MGSWDHNGYLSNDHSFDDNRNIEKGGEGNSLVHKKKTSSNFARKKETTTFLRRGEQDYTLIIFLRDIKSSLYSHDLGIQPKYIIFGAVLKNLRYNNYNHKFLRNFYMYIKHIKMIYSSSSHRRKQLQ